MKPLISAAAAALLLMGGRRGGSGNARIPSDRPSSPDHHQDPPEEQPVASDAVSSVTDSQGPLHGSFDASPVATAADITTATTLESRATHSAEPQPLVHMESTSRPHLPPHLPPEHDPEQDNGAQAEQRFGRTHLNNPLDWDWTDPPDDSSIWKATAAVLSGLSRSPSTDADTASSSKDPFEASFDALSAALRGLNIFPPKRDSTSSSSLVIGTPSDPTTADREEATSDRDSDPGSDPADVRPLIAVTIGVTLFLLARSPKAARRADLEPPPTLLDPDDDLLNPVVPDYSTISDLRSRTRHIVIVTTAAMPWMTGTAVNPLLRAAYLAKAGHTVSIVVPWLESPEDQRKVYPRGTSFTSMDEQTRVIRGWVAQQVPGVSVRVRYYQGVYSKEFGSILPLGDITAMFGDDEPRDVCVLEEPEHLTWHHTGARWASLFNFSVGVVHTNYIEYAKKHGMFGPQRALFLNFLNKWVCRSYCHRVIKLSDAVQTLPHSITCNVHGVRQSFIDIGLSRNGKKFENGAYFLGKVLWAKGYRQLVDLMDEHFERTEERLPIDFFGAGPDLEAVRRRVSESYGLSRVQIHGVVVDHASEYLQRYKVYVNPSKSDVVCTAAAEALAMGKFVICLEHPSNEFFATFDNCLIYRTPEEFSEKLAYALANEPKPLSDDDAYRLSWEAATERFYDASYIPSSPGTGRVDSALALTHKTICSTLVTPPANNAVRERYRVERKASRALIRSKRRAERARRKVPIF